MENLSDGILSEFDYDNIYYQTLNAGVITAAEKKYILNAYYILVERFLERLKNAK